MGAGFHGGFGVTPPQNTIRVIKANLFTPENLFTSSNNTDIYEIDLPPNDSQLKHIFRNSEGHLKDTPENRIKILELANDITKFIGTDKYGNSWNISNNTDGTQTWVRYRGNTINEAGENKTRRLWDPDFGLNRNPFKKS